MHVAVCGTRCLGQRRIVAGNRRGDGDKVV